MLELFALLYPSVVWMIHTEVHIEKIYEKSQKSRSESEFGAIIAIVVVAMVLKPRSRVLAQHFDLVTKLLVH